MTHKIRKIIQLKRIAGKGKASKLPAIEGNGFNVDPSSASMVSSRRKVPLNRRKLPVKTPRQAAKSNKTNSPKTYESNKSYEAEGS